MPILFGQIQGTDGSPIKILLDSASSASLITSKWVKASQMIKDSIVQWTTSAGVFRTKNRATLNFKLSEMFTTRVLTWKFHVTACLGSYGMILGRDVLKELGMTLDFKNNQVHWDTATIPMKTMGTTPNTYATSIPDAAAVKKIVENKYVPADLDKTVAEQHHLSANQQQQLRKLLGKYEILFDGTLGSWIGEKYNIQLKPGAKPYHARPYPVPTAYEHLLKQEVACLCQIGVLRKINRSEWAAPTFIIPKKDGAIRFLSDFRQLNQRIKRKPFPLPKIQDILMKLEGFTYGTSLDLNMGYYHVHLDPFSRQLCTIVLPFGKFEYQRLPMGLCNSPDIFQEKMFNLMGDLENVRAYIDDLLCLSHSTWEEHLEKLDVVFHRLRAVGLKVNIKKCFFSRSELEYLGYWITTKGIKPIPKKIDAMMAIKPPKTKKQLRGFIGMINYYRDMWIRRSAVLAPLTALTSKTAKWKWTDVEQKAFDTIKKILSKETLLVYPNFSKHFDIHTDASDYQMGAVISQENQPIAFFSRKLSKTQMNYTVGEKELLAIVECLKEYRNILLGQRIKIYTDHKNLTYANHTNSRIMRWRLSLEEYGPQLEYVKGESNVVADALSRLDLEDLSPTKTADPIHQLMAVDDVTYDDMFPLTFAAILKEQQKDNFLKNKVTNDDNYSVTPFYGGGKSRRLITFKGKICIPAALQKSMVQWYHEQLCHPGETRTEQTIRQHYHWINLRKTVHEVCSKCPTCQRTKKSTKKYGLLPKKLAEGNPWEKLCVDLIGPYTMKQFQNEKEEKTTLTLWCLTMIDPATGWMEIKQIKNKEAMHIADLVEQTWLTRYPWPTEITYDQGTEFMGDFATMIQNDYGIHRKPATTRNPQANAIIERAHQTIGNIIRTFEVHQSEMTQDSPWDGILSAVMFAMRATYHTTLQATPAQLVFGRDSIVNVKFEADWHLIRNRKQKMIRTNMERENSSRIPHTYQIGDQVLVRFNTKSKYGANPYKGPYPILRVNDNGTIQIRKGIYEQTINIRLVKPYNV